MPQSQARPNEAQFVRNLQRYLRQLSYDEQEIVAPPVDGIFEDATERALRSFQNLRGLPVTGRADEQTWIRLFSDYERSLEKNERSEALAVFPDAPPSFAVHPNDRYFLVEIIQYVLNELRLWYDNIPENSQSGVYDEVTQNGVLAFQKSHLLPENVNLDRDTWNALAQEFRRLSDRPEL